MPTKFPFKNLVFQGGGMKAFAYHGVLEVLEGHNVLQNIERVAGTSAGASIATLLSFRLNVQETLRIARSIDYAKVPSRGPGDERIESGKSLGAMEGGLDKLMGNLGAFNRLLRNYGWHTHNYVHDWLQDTIAGFFEGNGRATFDDFRERGFRDLHIVATNISTHSAVVFCADETPHVAVADAVIMSGSIPLYFEALQFDGEMFGKGDYYTDGGVLMNYPLHIFDDHRYKTGNRRFVHGINWETLGCRLYTPEECSSQDRDLSNIVRYIENLLETYGIAQSYAFENSLVNKLRTINVSNCGVSTIDFQIKPEESDQKYFELVQAGKTATREFLENYNPPLDRFYELRAELAELLRLGR